MLSLEHSFVKFNPNIVPNQKKSYKMYAAKNEYEACQIVVNHNCNINGVELCFTPFTDSDKNELKTELFREHYIVAARSGNAPERTFPDPLVPVKDGEIFDIKPNENIPFLLRVKTETESVAGMYFAKVELKQNGAVLETADITLKVWDFAIPVEPACATATLVSEEHIQKMHKCKSKEELETLYEKYFELMREHRFNAYSLPVDVLDEAADKYMDDPRVTAFRLDHKTDDEKIVAYRNKLCKNKKWLDKSYFYPFDEPCRVDQYEELKGMCERLRRLFPECHICTPFFKDPQMNETQDAIDYITGLVDIWCPKAPCYNDEFIYENLELKEDTFENRMNERIKNGDRVWWYVCWEPEEPYCNVFLDRQGIYSRILFWQQAMYNVKGFLYWTVNFWKFVDDPWTDMATVKDLSLDVYGDGSMLYNGNKVGIDGPCSSVRLEIVRDGLEDFEILTIAQRVLGKQKVREIISKVTTSVTECIHDNDVFANVRVELGEMLEAAMK